jgi:hypothetical protein
MEQIMEFMKANKAHQEEMMARMEARMDSNQHEMKVQIGGLASRMDADKAESMIKMERLLADNREMKATIRSGQKEMIKAITGASQESTEACEEKAEMAVNSIHSELEGKINARMEYAMAVADKQTQALREELNQKVEEAEQRIQASIDTRTRNFQDDITSTGTED